MTEDHRPISHREPAAAIIARPWRVGAHTGRAVYCGPEDGAAIGWFDTRELAAHVVAVHNAAVARGGEG